MPLSRVLPNEDPNLINHAAKDFFQFFQRRLGITVHIQKPVYLLYHIRQLGVAEAGKLSPAAQELFRHPVQPLQEFLLTVRRLIIPPGSLLATGKSHAAIREIARKISP